MTGSLNDGTKINHGLTGLAVGSSGITVLGTGSGLVLEGSQLCIMDVVRRRNGGQFGSNADGACEGILIVDHTVNNLNVNVYNGLVTHVSRCVVGIVHVVVTVERPNANRDAHKSVIESLAAYTISFNGHSQDLGNSVVLEGSLEAGGNDGTLGLPLVSVVQLQLCDQLVHVGQISHVDVHVVNGLSLGSLAGIVVAAQLHHGIAGNGEGTGDLHGVAQLVLYLKGNGMNTRAQRNVALGGKRVTVNGSLNCHTVHSDLTGGQIQSSVIGNSSGECHVVTVDYGTVIQGNSGIGGGVGGGGDGGQNSVIHSGGIVQSNVVNVEGNYVRGFGLNVSTEEGRRTAVPFVGSHGHAEIVVLGNINGCVDPTGLGNIRIGSRVQVGLLAGRGRGKHEVILLAGIRAVSILNVELRLERKTLTGSGERVLGNVQPHTQGGCLHSVGHVTEHDDLVADVEQDVIRPARKGSIGIIQSPSQGVVTVANLTAVGGGRDEGLAAQVLVELTR